jgi:hypothetical protein
MPLLKAGTNAAIGFYCNKAKDYSRALIELVTRCHHFMKEIVKSTAFMGGPMRGTSTLRNHLAILAMIRRSFSPSLSPMPSSRTHPAHDE